MDNILIGNGININFGGYDNFSNKAILTKLENENFSISKLLENDCDEDNTYGKWSNDVDNELVLKVLNEVVAVLSSKDRSLALYLKLFGHSEVLQREIKTNGFVNVLNKYITKNNLKYFDIGLEDYLYILSINCEKKELEMITVIFNLLINDCVINNKVIFSETFKQRLYKYNKIFTLNYDLNIEKNVEKPVYHLHGQFNVLEANNNKKHILGFSKPYIEMYDCAISKNIIPYCNTIYGFTGFDKLEKISNVDKFYNSYNNYSLEELEKACEKINEYRQDEDSRSTEEWREFLKNYDSSVHYTYHTNDFINMKGKLDIVGISPNNDTHLSNMIMKNKKLNKIIYYYFSEEDLILAKKVFKNDKRVKYKHISKLDGWHMNN